MTSLELFNSWHSCYQTVDLYSLFGYKIISLLTFDGVELKSFI